MSVNLLGLDTSTAASAACVLRRDGEAFESAPSVEALLGSPAHARELMPAAAGCLERSGLRWAELDAVAVGVGPGGFTGLRIGVATAHGLARAHGIGLWPVSSLAALARETSEPRRLALIDARRGEVYAALYDGEAEVIAPFAAPPAEAASRALAHGMDPLAVGDGSLRFREVLETAGVRVAKDGSPEHVVRALSICRLAAATTEDSHEAVLPHYVRAPDAKASR